MVECLECGCEIELEDVEEGELIVCPECGTEMEVVSLNPPVVEAAPEEEEDWGE
jgi:alpha-aminoadipate carrier protein LysW